MATPRGRGKFSTIRLPYEICSQVSRATACAVSVVAATETSGQFLNVTIIALAFGLGLLRLAGGIRWRHSALHQTNVLLVGSLVLVSVAELLPLIRLSSDHVVDKMLFATVVSLSAAIIIALVTPREWIGPDAIPLGRRLPPNIEPSPEESCSWFDYFVSYGWLTPIVWKGARKAVDMSDLPGLPWYDEPLYLFSRMETARRKHSKTLRALASAHGWELLNNGLWIGAAFALDFLTPFGMYQLLNYLSAPEQALLHPAIWIFLMFAGPMSRSIAYQGYVFRSTRLIVRVKSAMTQELYNRAMGSMELEEDVVNALLSKGKKKTLQGTASGRLANLMASDIDAVTACRDAIAVVCGVPIGMALSVIGLYKVAGWASFAGIGILIASLPLLTWIARLQSGAQRKVKVAQDSRISLVSEYLESIKAVRYFAWEDAVLENIAESRRREQKGFWRINILVSMMGSLGDLIPALALLAIFTLHTAVLGRPLTASIAFTTLTLITTLRANIMQVVFFSRNFTSAMISLERLDTFFDNTVPLVRHPTGPLAVKQASFRRNKKATFRLQDISINFVEGGLNVVTGQSGSGKTTLLLAILGETLLEGGCVTRPEDVAFASQTAWLQSESIRDNISFNSPFEQTRYDRVIEACCMGIDFSELPNGDATEVGENGARLSGRYTLAHFLARVCGVAC